MTLCVSLRSRQAHLLLLEESVLPGLTPLSKNARHDPYETLYVALLSLLPSETALGGKSFDEAQWSISTTGQRTHEDSSCSLHRLTSPTTFVPMTRCLHSCALFRPGQVSSPCMTGVLHPMASPSRLSAQICCKPCPIYIWEYYP
jgi:hypothetical protein